MDAQFVEELAHYCLFANAAYGWKGSAFCGHWNLFGGNNRVLVRSTGIEKRDIVVTNWSSKVTRPVSIGGFYCCMYSAQCSCVYW